MSRHEIKCINKSERLNPHERIINVGGVNADGSSWKITQPRAIELMDNGEKFFVKKDGSEIDVIIATHNGNRYIKTKPDNERENNLLYLPECR